MEGSLFVRVRSQQSDILRPTVATGGSMIIREGEGSVSCGRRNSREQCHNPAINNSLIKHLNWAGYNSVPARGLLCRFPIEFADDGAIPYSP